MKPRMIKRALVIVLAVCLLAASAAPAGAHRRARGRWQGLFIGLGAVSAYNFFSHGVFSPFVPRGYGAFGGHWARRPHTAIYSSPVIYSPPVVYQAAPVCPPPAGYGCPPAYEYPPPDCPPPERFWVPGYWTTTRTWVPGHWDYR